MIKTPHTQTLRKKRLHKKKKEFREFEENYVGKKTALPSLRNQDWKTVKVETEKINELFARI